jgi:ABC-type branched-subunit amino acid transport system substrate-binding protein
LKEAIEKAGTIEVDAVRSALMNIEFKGLSGPISFNADREPAESKFMILQIKDGEFVHIDIS